MPHGQAEGDRANVRRVFGMIFRIMLGAAIWGLHSPIRPLVSAAQAQTRDDYPTSFTGSLVEPSLDRVAIRRTVYVAVYSTVRLASGR